MINVKVFNREKAKRETFHPQPNPFCIISISTPRDFPNSFAKNPNLKEILFLEFDDIVSEEHERGIFMSADDAEKVVKFCEKNLERGVEEIWVHCDAGISRSAGVAAAILKHYTGDDTQIWDSPRYYPNDYCYRRVMNAFSDLEQKT